MPVGVIPSHSHHLNSSQCYTPKCQFAKDKNFNVTDLTKNTCDKNFILFHSLILFVSYTTILDGAVGYR